MKIYSKIVFDMATMAVIHEVATDYHGDIALCKGGGSNEVKETSQEKALAEISMQQWGEYQDRFRPFEDEWISDIEKTPEDRAKISGQVAAAVGNKFDANQAGIIKSSVGRGAAPGSGAFKAAMGQNALQRGAVASKGIAAATQAVDDQTYTGLQQAISMGRGEAAEATRDMTTLARDAANSAIGDARNSSEAKSSMVSSAMSAAGMGLAGWQNSQTPTIKAEQVKIKY